jgi:aminoglycoside phosphotransferase (APT) family kinase protein
MSEPYSHFQGTRTVDERLRFNQDRLAAWMRENVVGFNGLLEVSQFKGGQSNPTYLLGAGDRRWVLRRKPPGKLLASAHAVDREYRVISALKGSGVPVAGTHGVCLDDGVIGTAFYVMDFVDGRVFWDPTLPGLANAERRAVYDEMNRVIARLHALDPGAYGLADFGKPGNYLARQIDRWTRQYQASPAGPIAAMDRLVEWLPAHLPSDDETTLVHGDYRLDNLIFHPTEPRILAVLDWELSTLGHPLADFSYHCLTWHFPSGGFRGFGEADLSALDIPAEAEYVAAYCRRVGRTTINPGAWEFYLAYNLFRLAGILHGIMGRVIEGTAASAAALEQGRSAPVMAGLAWQMVQRIENRRCAGPGSRI